MSITYKAIEFLGENRFQNSKEWYDEHKDAYRNDVVEPLAELVRALERTIKVIDPEMIVSPKIDGSISRVRRDTRFSADKSLYRDTAWITFMRNKKYYDGLPGYFMEFSPRFFRYGCGYYTAGTDSLASIRKLITEGDPSFIAAKKCYETQNVFGFEGEKYKRAKFPDYPEDVRDWLERKNFDFIRNSEDFSILFADDFADVLARDFMLIAPIYKFLIKAETKKLEK